MTPDNKALIEEARKRVIEGFDKEKYLFDPEYHVWVTQCANAAETGVRLVTDALEASEAEKERLMGLVTSTKDGPCQPTLEGIAKFLTGHVGDESQTLLLIYLMLTRLAVHSGLPVSLPQFNQELEAQLQQIQARLEEATRHLRRFVTLIGPKHTIRQEAEQFLASLQDNTEPEEQ